MVFFLNRKCSCILSKMSCNALECLHVFTKDFTLVVVHFSFFLCLVFFYIVSASCKFRGIEGMGWYFVLSCFPGICCSYRDVAPVCGMVNIVEMFSVVI